ncbi:expressed unknown protein [Seminavis robusta]|uniref:Uncharacterized protein n=1 Tax=Seminavis robusta TaxID=568900 RepID=A0A9N8EHE3_9STRA|nr:expressed unknown protein [Seminavis robusta]|eukprot:Sro1210_g252780.1 n/a (193) ;mRNA; r:21307-21885
MSLAFLIQAQQTVGNASIPFKMAVHKRRRLSLQDQTLPSSRKRTSEEPTARSAKRMKKSVSFNDDQNKKVTIDIRTDEKQNAWYNRSEYRVFREDIQTTLLSVRLGVSQLMEPTDFCLRGLEANVSPNVGMLRKVKRKILISSVLQEQRSQRIVGAVKPDVIRDVSAVLSTDALVDAVKRGLSDCTDAHFSS